MFSFHITRKNLQLQITVSNSAETTVALTIKRRVRHLFRLIPGPVQVPALYLMAQAVFILEEFKSESRGNSSHRSSCSVNRLWNQHCPFSASSILCSSCWSRGFLGFNLTILHGAAHRMWSTFQQQVHIEPCKWLWSHSSPATSKFCTQMCLTREHLKTCIVNQFWHFCSHL